MRRDTLFITILSIFLICLFAFGSRLGMRLQTLLAGPVPQGSAVMESIATISRTIEGYGVMRTTNAAGGRNVPVYSRYPFNLKNEFLLAVGEDQHVEAGDVALYQGSVFGSVEKVFKGSALVQTVFDSRTKIPVRIGAAGADARLVGGPEPRLTLIPKAADISENAAVYAAGVGWPYGAPLGTLRGLEDAPDNIYRIGTLRVFYNPAGVTEVTLLPHAENR